MFITYNETGKVTAYSDKSRHPNDIKEDETQCEVDIDFNIIECVDGGLIFEDGILKNNGEAIANQISE